MDMAKVVILGAGHVGSMCALNLARLGICREIVLIDIVEGKADAQAKDVADATVFMDRLPIGLNKKIILLAFITSISNYLCVLESQVLFHIFQKWDQGFGICWIWVYCELGDIFRINSMQYNFSVI